MINKIFFDLDECLIHTELREPTQKHISFCLDDYGGTYYSIVRPCAKRLIEFARNLIGAENVFILTAAIKPYACEINRLAEFGFPEDQILSREDINNHYFATAYGGGSILASQHAHVDNVLIDNLEGRYNQDKVSFIGIWRSLDTNYLKIRDYYGVNFPDDPFEENVMNFLEERHKAPSLCKKEGEEGLEVQAR